MGASEKIGRAIPSPLANFFARSHFSRGQIIENRLSPTETLASQAIVYYSSLNYHSTVHFTIVKCSVGPQKFCVWLYGPKSLTGFKLYATSANYIVVVLACKRTQRVGPSICFSATGSGISGSRQTSPAFTRLHLLFGHWEVGISGSRQPETETKFGAEFSSTFVFRHLFLR